MGRLTSSAPPCGAPSVRLGRSLGTAVLVTLMILGLPTVAFACPGCLSGNEANRIAYIVTFVILTVLPLACVGLLVRWYVKKAVAAEAAAELAPELED